MVELQIVSWAEILLFVFLVAVTIMVVRQVTRSRSAATLFWGLTCSALLVGTVLVKLYFSTMSPSQYIVGGLNNERTESARTSSLQRSVVAAVQMEPAVWADLDLQQFHANGYPDVLAAVKPLARKVRDTLDAIHLSGESEADENGGATEVGPGSAAAISEQVVAVNKHHCTPVHVNVIGHVLIDKDREDVLQRFVEELHTAFPDSEVGVSAGRDTEQHAENEIAADTVVLTLSLEEESDDQAPWDANARQSRGLHRCRISTSKGSALATSRFIDKPWVDGFDMFVSARPDRRLVVGYSGKLVSSEVEARRLAMQDARWKLHDAIDHGTIVAPNESHVIDRFAQKLSRPYGDVWREAVLLDVSESRMASAIAAARRQTMRVRQHHTSVTVGLLILFAVTVFLCVCLNSLTQGYYRERLLMTGGVAAAIVLVLFLASFEGWQTEASAPVPVVRDVVQ